MYAYDTTYDENLYLQTSIILYLDDPTDNPDARRDYESVKKWNKDGVRINHNVVDYDSEGIRIFEGKWRSAPPPNALRGEGGFGFYETVKEYEAGRLTAQEERTFNEDGYPKTWRIDENGDGTFELIYHAEITKTPEGYLESVTWTEESTGNNYIKKTLAYDDNGLLKNSKDYDWENGEFILSLIISDVWYENPVNGPTGGDHVWFQSDEAGNPVGEYEIIDWTVTQKTHHYYSSPGEEFMRITESLEEVTLQ